MLGFIKDIEDFLLLSNIDIVFFFFLFEKENDEIINIIFFVGLCINLFN